MARSLKLGVLLDGPFYRAPERMLNAIQLKLDEVNAASGVEGRQVEMVLEEAAGAHDGLPENLVGAYHRLIADREVIGVIGPGITDNCLVLVDDVQRAKVPTICWPGSEDCRGEWYFQFQVGSFADETLYLARGLRADGHRRIGVLQTRTTGMYYFRHFEREARFLDLVIAGKEYASVHERDVTRQLTALRDLNPDAILFLGMGEPTQAFCRDCHRMGWSVPRFGNIAFLGIAQLPEAALGPFEGVIWVDQYEPRNPTLQAFQAKYRARYGVQPFAIPQPGAGWDMATLMVEGLKRAPNLSRAGLKEGLESVKQIPACTGGVHPTMGFCKWDRQALKGPDLMMHRRVRGGRVESYAPGAG
jgi:ABC-type branched-subunit amino acid transport system substrate-binding protein